MNLQNTLSGGASVMKRYKINATVATGGIPLLRGATSNAGVINATTTSLADFVGVSVDAATYTTTQAADMIEGVVSVIINPDAVWRALMTSSATSAQLNIVTNSVAETAGTVVTITTGDAAPNSPTMLDGTMLCVAGANYGLTRNITSVAATTATATVPFPQDIAASSVWILVPFQPAQTGASAVTVDLVTNLRDVRADADAAGGGAIEVVDVEFDTGSQARARQNSYLHFLAADHFLKGGRT